MAEEERAKTNFNDILNSINRRYEIIHTKWSDNRLFEAKFRTQIPRNNEDFNSLCDEWVDLFSEATNTVWAKKISNTGPKIRFRKQYQCWTHGGKVVQKELLFDAKRCRGTLDVKVLTDNPLTRRKNKHIRLGLNVVVKINFIHLHDVDTAQPFSFFVHNCKPQLEAPKIQIQPNDRLPQLVAEMVQKGQKYMQPSPPTDTVEDITRKEDLLDASLITLNPEPPKLDGNPQEIQTNIDLSQQTSIQLVQNVPLHSLDTVKLEIQPQMQPFAQVVFSGPQLEVAEHLLMCQPLMFDSTQVIHNLPSHFVQLHNTQGQFL